jgi:hypothetical protein
MMKKSSLLMIAVALILSSCGMASKYTSASSGSRFQDGIYSSDPSFRSKEEKEQNRAQTDALVEETKASFIYLFGDKKDTVMIPENMSASIRYDKSLASTVVTVGENPYAWQNNIDPWYYYTPYSVGSSWYWSRHYAPWYSNAWYWSRWHHPYSYYYGGWYDPWYYGGFWDPWYYGGCYGWYPYWGHHHHHYYPSVPVHNEDRWNGNRRQTGSDRVFTSRVSARGGVASASRVSRSTSAQSVSAGRVSGSAVSSGRTTAKRVTTTAANSAAYRHSAAAVEKPANRTVTRTTANYRKPEGTTRPSGSVTRSSYGSTSGSSSTSRSYGTGNSSSYRSSSSPAPQTRTSSFNGGSSGRSFSGGGSSGATRGGSSGGTRR